MTTRQFGPHSVEVSNEDKLLFPDSGLTKGDLIDYCEAFAETMLQHLRDRPLALHRFPWAARGDAPAPGRLRYGQGTAMAGRGGDPWQGMHRHGVALATISDSLATME